MISNPWTLAPEWAKAMTSLPSPEPKSATFWLGLTFDNLMIWLIFLLFEGTNMAPQKAMGYMLLRSREKEKMRVMKSRTRRIEKSRVVVGYILDFIA